jgi:hypothetical protein
MDVDHSGFSREDGREVFAVGEHKIWRCPICAWWREWSETRCCSCGTFREVALAPARRRKTTKVRAAAD